MRALILPLTPRSLTHRVANVLAEELRWRGFEPAVESGAGPSRDVSGVHLVVLVFGTVAIPPAPAVPLAPVTRVLERLDGLDGRAVALLAVSATGAGGPLRALGEQVERHGARLVAVAGTAPAGRRRGLIDLAAECMVRVTR